MPDDETARGARFEALVQRQSRFVFKVAYSVLRNPDATDDAVQETFLKLYRSGAWEGMQDEKAFLARVAWRIAVGRLPRRERERELLDRAATEDTPEDGVIRADWIATVHGLVDALPRELRQVMSLSGIEGMNSGEIANTIGVPARDGPHATDAIARNPEAKTIRTDEEQFLWKIIATLTDYSMTRCVLTLRNRGPVLNRACLAESDLTRIVSA